MHRMNKLTDSRKNKEKMPGLAWATPRWLLTVLRATEKDSYLRVSSCLGLAFGKYWTRRTVSAPHRPVWTKCCVVCVFTFTDSAHLPQEQGMACGCLARPCLPSLHTLENPAVTLPYNRVAYQCFSFSWHHPEDICQSSIYYEILKILRR